MLRPLPAPDPERRSRLLAIKLAALVRDHAGDAPVAPGVFALGAGLVREGEAWVYAAERPGRSLGPALAWARQQGACGVHLLVDEDEGVLARRAGEFSTPVSVWKVEGRALVAAVPAPHDEAPDLDPRLATLAEVIVAAGAEPLVERGVLVGEVGGLEVCRAVADPAGGAIRLEVGIGAHDREAFGLLHGDVPTAEALRGVVEAVSRHRSADPSTHPLARLARERWLRRLLLATPSLVGASRLAPADPPVARTNLKDPVPCVASGETDEGRPLVVICSAGVDLDLVPFAADARSRDGRPGALLRLVTPSRDAAQVNRALSAQLREPAEWVTIDR